MITFYGPALPFRRRQAARVLVARAADRRGLFATSRASRVAANRLYQQLGFQLRDSNVYRYEPQPRPR